jgi:hypothetical protein
VIPAEGFAALAEQLARKSVPPAEIARY